MSLSVEFSTKESQYKKALSMFGDGQTVCRPSVGRLFRKLEKAHSQPLVPKIAKFYAKILHSFDSHPDVAVNTKHICQILDFALENKQYELIYQTYLTIINSRFDDSLDVAPEKRQILDIFKRMPGLRIKIDSIANPRNKAKRNLEVSIQGPFTALQADCVKSLHTFISVDKLAFGGKADLTALAELFTHVQVPQLLVYEAGDIHLDFFASAIDLLPRLKHFNLFDQNITVMPSALAQRYMDKLVVNSRNLTTLTTIAKTLICYGTSHLQIIEANATEVISCSCLLELKTLHAQNAKSVKLLQCPAMEKIVIDQATDFFLGKYFPSGKSKLVYFSANRLEGAFDCTPYPNLQYLSINRITELKTPLPNGCDAACRLEELHANSLPSFTYDCSFPVLKTLSLTSAVEVDLAKCTSLETLYVHLNARVHGSLEKTNIIYVDNISKTKKAYS